MRVLQWADIDLVFMLHRLCQIIAGLHAYPNIRVTAERDPADLMWGYIDADLIIESTGVFLTIETAMKHIDAGA